MASASAPVHAFISVGSNIDAECNTLAAVELLQRDVALLAASTFYRTAPVGRGDQPEFLNGVLLVETALSPWALNADVLRKVEAALGRRRTADKYAPRPLDLDLILYGDRAIDEDGVRIPHPDLYRPFVGLLIVELAPELVLPGSGRRLASVLGVDLGARDGLYAGIGRPDGPVTKAVRERLGHEH